ncbi:hypothetical protein Agub_g3161, partial [Astrephomene gubernaculifera]
NSGSSRSSSSRLVVSELQRLQWPGVSALVECRYSSSSSSSSGGASDSEGHEEGGQQQQEEHVLLVGLSYNVNGSFAAKSAVFKWDSSKRQFTLWQMLGTSGAHGGRCFTVGHTQQQHPASSGRGGSSGSGSSRHGNGVKSSAGGAVAASKTSGEGGAATLFLAIAESRSVNSSVWRLDPTDDLFVLHQNVPTVGAHDVQHMGLAVPSASSSSHSFSAAIASGTAAGTANQHSGSMWGSAVDVLVFANRGADELCSPSQSSPVLVWHPQRRRFESSSAHLAGMQCATGLATGT